MPLNLGSSDAKIADQNSSTTEEGYETGKETSLDSKEAAEYLEPKKLWLVVVATYVSFGSSHNLDAQLSRQLRWLVQFCTYGCAPICGLPFIP
jgi:hypothetical protein